MTNVDARLQDGNDAPAHLYKSTVNPKRTEWHSGCGVQLCSLTEDPTMGVIGRCMATLRGEQCFITVNGRSEMMSYRRGQEIVAGDRTYIVTRILRARSDPRVPSWEIWARPAKN